MRFSVPGVALVAVLAAGCASKSDLAELRTSMLAEMRAIRASQDSLTRELRGSLIDSLQTVQQRQARGRTAQQRQIDEIQRSLSEILDLLGQLERRVQRSAPAGGGAGPVVVPGPMPAGGGSGAGGEDAAAALYNSAQNQFNRGAYETARSGFADYLRSYPGAQLAPDAQFYLARTYEETGEPDAALTEYARVLELYPNSRRAPSALYASGRIELDRGSTQDAAEFFSRVVRGYPNSDEAILAQQRLNDLRR